MKLSVFHSHCQKKKIEKIFELKKMSSNQGDDSYMSRMMRRMSSKSRREIEELAGLGFLDVVGFCFRSLSQK